MNTPEPNETQNGLNDIPEMPTVEMPTVEIPAAEAPAEAPAEETPAAEAAPAEETPAEPATNAYGMPNGNPYAHGASDQTPPYTPYTSYNRPLYEVATPGVNGFAIASLVTGIVSIVCCCFLYGFSLIPAVLAVVFAVLSRKASGGRFSGMAIAGLVTGIVGIALGAYMLYSFIIFLSMPDEEIQELLKEYGFVIGEDGSITLPSALCRLFF